MTRSFVPGKRCSSCGARLVAHRNARGMCSRCYQKDRHSAGWMPLPVPPLHERLFSRLEITPSGCLLWTGTVDRGGYGKITFVGPVPDGMELDHLCHSRDAVCPGGDGCMHRRCASPDHLEIVSPLVNTRRAFARAATRAARKPQPATWLQRGAFAGGSPQYKGVTWHKQRRKWQAIIQIAGKSRYLGVFASEEKAAEAYDMATVEAFGTGVYLNLPDRRPS